MWESRKKEMFILFTARNATFRLHVNYENNLPQKIGIQGDDELCISFLQLGPIPIHDQRLSSFGEADLRLPSFPRFSGTERCGHARRRKYAGCRWARNGRATAILFGFVISSWSATWFSNAQLNAAIVQVVQNNLSPKPQAIGQTTMNSTSGRKLISPRLPLPRSSQTLSGPETLLQKFGEAAGERTPDNKTSLNCVL